MKYKDILFTDTKGIPGEYAPVPASKFIPEWYQKTQSYINGKKKPYGNGSGGTPATIKKCIPVFDAITSGYIIVTYSDIYVSQKDGAPFYEWSSNSAIEFHPVEQAPLHPDGNGLSYPKFVNGWAIKTPNRYSVLITQPFHRDAPFKILDGIVDTDKYITPIHFPFVLKDSKWEGLIPAGTPIAQIIPFKRDSWKMSIGGDEDRKDHVKTIVLNLSIFFDRYKTFWWSRKEYK